MSVVGVHQIDVVCCQVSRKRLFLGLTALVMVALLMGGCAGYQIGPQALYRPDIHTVYVPMFESDTLRRRLGEWLTEAVIKEIEQSTTYKVVGRPPADSTLTGRLIQDEKRALTENLRDEPNDIEHSIVVQIQWVNARGGVLVERTFGLPTPLVGITDAAELVPQVGQSVVTAQQELIQDLAAQIVGQLEMPW
tara:strand:+ start:504 stop:1082 length:579 start_codon:yes stop_codon:yes gene_type:complete